MRIKCWNNCQEKAEGEVSKMWIKFFKSAFLNCSEGTKHG